MRAWLVAGFGIGGSRAVATALAGVLLAAAGLGESIGIPVWSRVGLGAVGLVLAIAILVLTVAEHTAEPRERRRRRRGWTEHHFEPRGRGVARPSEAGQDFTGRTVALQRLVEWLGADGGGLCVVTGNPGSGKSAVLGRFVALADPRRRAALAIETLPAQTVPPVGSVDVAIWAKGMQEEQVVEAIAEALHVAASDARTLADAVAARGRPAVIVVDALDEAAVDEARPIAQRVIKPLGAVGREHGVKVLVGTRRGHHDALLNALDASRVIDLDAPDYLDPEDLVEYARRRLLREAEPKAATPYRDQPAAAARVAAAIAQRAGKSFLVAHLASGALRRDALVADGAEADFPADVKSAMDDYLDRYADEEQRVRARALLTALAYGEGAGLPHDLWPQVAGALAGTAYGVGDVHWVLHTPAGDLVSSSENATPRHRLFHGALGELLREQSGPERAGQQRIAAALEATVADRDWSRAPPYVRAHLATHAAAAGVLDELLQDPGFLMAAEPAALLAALPTVTTTAAAPVRRAYRQVAHLLAGRPDPERASHFELAARRTGAAALADRIARAEPDRPWAVPWSQWEHRGEFFLAGRHEEEFGGLVVKVAVGEVDRRPVGLTVAAGGTLCAWDLDGGGPFGAGLVGRHAGPRAVGLGALDGRPAAVSAHTDGTLRIWDLIAGGPIGEPLTGQGEVNAVAVGDVDGRDVAITGGEDGGVRVWDLAAGRRLHEPLGGHDGAVHSVAVLDAVAVTGGADGIVQTWDLPAGRPLRPPFALGGSLRAVGLGQVSGTALAIAGGGAGARVWNAMTGEPVGRPLDDARSPLAVAVGELDGRAVAVTATTEFRLCLWEVGDARPLREPSTGHGWLPGMVAAGVLGGRPLAVAGGLEGEVWAYDLLAAGSADQSPDDSGHASELAIGELDGRPVVVSASAFAPSIRISDLRDGVPRGSPVEAGGNVRALAVSGALTASADAHGGLRVWDLATRTVVSESTVGGYGVSALHLGELGGRSFLLSRAYGLVCRSDPNDLGSFREPLGEPEPAIGTASALATLDGRAVLVLGHEDGRLSLWDVATGEPLGETTAGHDGGVRAIAVDGPVAVSGGEDRTVRMWDLGALAALGRPLVGHRREVDAVALAQRAGRPVVVSGCDDQTVRVWDLDGAPPAVIEVGSYVNCLAARGGTVVVGTSAGLLALSL